MITDKIYIADKQAFIEWKRKYTTHTGKFYAECYCEKEPKSYPCILLEIDEYNTKKGKKLLSLVVHHKTYKNLFNEVETNYKDLITLCSPCHRAIHMVPNNRNRFKFNEDKYKN